MARQVRKTTGIRALLALSVAAATSVVAVPLAAAPASAASGVVMTTGGLVSGTTSATERKFFGVPFAAPPVGALRFHAPEPVQPWTGVKAATASGPPCSQTSLLGGALSGSNENCLDVDVYAPPAATSHNLPVMVWIYGGGYVQGSTSQYDPTPLVTGGNAIVIEVSYRLGAFGFLSLPGLDGESPAGTSGDYGLMDQQAGLRWVQQNAAAFGGNPHNVTIFGESAGGNSICQQVASPLAVGLFQKAISESGSCSGSALQSATKAEIEQRSEAFAAGLGCTVPATALACLRALPASTLLSSKTESFDSMQLTWEPSVDGYVEPRTLDDAWRTGNYQHLPMIVGNNLNEGRLFVAEQTHILTLLPLTTAAYTAYAQQTFGAQAPSVLATYSKAAYGSDDLAESAVITDFSFACPAVNTESRAAATGQHIWAYEFADPDPPLSNLDPYMPLGDYHGSELWSLFNTVSGIPLLYRNPGQAQLSAQMVAAWTTFARTGQPGAIGGSAWPAWSATAPQAMSLTHLGSHLVTNLAAEHNCEFWAPISH